MIAGLGVVAMEYDYYSDDNDDSSDMYYNSMEEVARNGISEEDIDDAIKEAQDMYKHNIMRNMKAYFDGKYIKKFSFKRNVRLCLSYY